jgi:hypothetical protein
MQFDRARNWNFEWNGPHRVDRNWYTQKLFWLVVLKNCPHPSRIKNTCQINFYVWNFSYKILSSLTLPRFWKFINLLQTISEKFHSFLEKMLKIGKFRSIKVEELKFKTKMAYFSFQESVKHIKILKICKFSWGK